MKKILLIPTALAVTSAPIISLSGCANNKEVVVIDCHTVISDTFGEHFESEPVLLNAHTTYKLVADYSKMANFHPFSSIGCKYDSDVGEKWGPLNMVNVSLKIGDYDIPRYRGFGENSGCFDVDPSRYGRPEIWNTWTNQKRTDKLELTFDLWCDNPVEVWFVMFARW